MASTGPEFAGSKGSGADINLNVPLPGAHDGRRILKLEDIPDTYWLESAKTSGSSYAQVLGLSLDASTSTWSISNPEKLVGAWTSKKGSVSSKVSATQLATVRSALVADAADVQSTRGSLSEWTSSGKVFKSVAPPVTKA